MDQETKKIKKANNKLLLLIVGIIALCCILGWYYSRLTKSKELERDPKEVVAEYMDAIKRAINETGEFAYSMAEMQTGEDVYDSNIDYYSKGGRVARHITEKTPDSIIRQRFIMDKNFTYVIDDEEKNITVYPMGMNDVSDRNYFKNDIIDGAMDAAADIKDAGRQIDGKDVVCLEYLDAVKTVVYFDKKTGQPLLMETLEIGGNKAIRFSNFKFGGIDDAIFELPEGYKKVDIFN